MTEAEAEATLADLDATDDQTTEALQVLGRETIDITAYTLDTVRTLVKMWIIYVALMGPFTVVMAMRGAYGALLLPVWSACFGSFWTGLALGRHFPRFPSR
jgi:hypothetical protein